MLKSISRSSLLSIDGGRWTLAPVLELKIMYRIRYRIRCRVRCWGRAKKTLFVHSICIRYRWKTVDIGYDIQFRPTLYTLYVFDIEVFIRDRVHYRIAISGYPDIEGKNFDVVHDVGAISGYTDIDVFSSISNIWSMLGTICHTWGGWAHRSRSNPRRWVQPPGPRPSWTVCTLGWLSWRPFLLELSSCFLLLQWPGPGVYCRQVTVHSPDFTHTHTHTHKLALMPCGIKADILRWG